MQYPKLYEQIGSQASQDATNTLNTHFKLLKPKHGCTVLDVGCGPGNVTHDLLYPMFSNSVKSLVGIDRSKSMIEFAKKYYSQHPKMSFATMDITGDVPDTFKETFDHIVSFYCLHLVSDHRKALFNIYKMLKPGGNVLLSFMGSCVIFDIYKDLINEDGWSVYLHNQHVGPPTQTSKRPSNDFKNFLTDVGFNVHFVEEANKDYIYTTDEFRKIAIAVNIFQFPQYLQDKFVLYQMDYLRNHKLVDLDSNGDEYFHQPYTLLTAFASKPN